MVDFLLKIKLPEKFPEIRLPLFAILVRKICNDWTTATFVSDKECEYCLLLKFGNAQGATT